MLTYKYSRKKSFGFLRRIWDGNIKMDNNTRFISFFFDRRVSFLPVGAVKTMEFIFLPK